MNKDILQKLEQIGLTESEAELYLTSLHIGPASAIQLGRKVNVTRQMIYVLLPPLIEKGLIKQTKIGARQYYVAADPEILIDLVEKSKQIISDLVPILKSHQATNAAVPLITVYENPIAMREWYRHMLENTKKGEEMLIWSSGGDWLMMDEPFYQDYIAKKNKIGNNDKLIVKDTPEARAYYASIRVPNGEWRFIKDDWDSNAELWIWNDEVCFQTLRENATNLIVIKSADLAAVERFNFYNIWNRLGQDNNATPQIQRTTQKVMFEREGKILMMKDTKGQWELPGGTIDFGEEMEAALHREIEEEMGLKPDQYEIHEMRGNFNIISHVNGKHYHYLALVYRGELKADDFQLSSEHTESAWLTIPEILKLKMVEGYREFFEKII